MNPTIQSIEQLCYSQGTADENIAAPRRGSRARRPPVEYWKPVGLVGQNVPSTYGEAINSDDADEWQAAMDVEMRSIRKNKTWRLTSRPKHVRVMRGKWVDKIKSGVDGMGAKTRRFKARWCFMVNRQIKGIDFTETIEPVAKFTTIRVLLAIVAALGWALHQMDFKTAFLYGDLN